MKLCKRQFHRLHPDKKNVDCPLVIESEKSSLIHESPKKHQHFPLPCTVFEKYPNIMEVLKGYWDIMFKCSKIWEPIQQLAKIVSQVSYLCSGIIIKVLKYSKKIKIKLIFYSHSTLPIYSFCIVLYSIFYNLFDLFDSFDFFNVTLLFESSDGRTFPYPGFCPTMPAGWRWFKEEIHLSMAEAFWCNVNFCCNHNLVYLWRPKKWVSKCCLIPLYSQIFQSSKVIVFEQFKILSHRLCNLDFKCLRGECNFNYLDYSLEAIRSRNIKLLHYIFFLYYFSLLLTACVASASNHLVHRFLTGGPSRGLRGSAKITKVK